MFVNKFRGIVVRVIVYFIFIGGVISVYVLYVVIDVYFIMLIFEFINVDIGEVVNVIDVSCIVFVWRIRVFVDIDVVGLFCIIIFIDIMKVI